MRMQKMLDGTEIPESDPSAAELIEKVLNSSADISVLLPTDIVILAWMCHPRVSKFIEDASTSSDCQEVSALYFQHLNDMAKFETWARAGRAGRNTACDEQFIFSTNWYQQYLQTNHWKKMKLEARQHFDNNCVFCGSTNELELHHRKYDYLGEEIVKRDLTLLCHACHTRNTPFLLSYLPAEEPIAVQRIRKSESIPGIYVGCE